MMIEGLSRPSRSAEPGKNRHQTRPRLPLVGVIAVVGCDGSGKSTLAADLLTRLRNERPTELRYLGQDSGNILRWILGVPLVGPAAGRYLVRKSERAHAKDDKPSSPDTVTALIIHLLSRWRSHKFRRMMALSRQGVVVVTDRYPQAEVPGFHFDGPGLVAPEVAKGLVGRLAIREQRLYEYMASYVPDLVIRLNIDADTAHARKPDHKLTMLRDKARVIPTLTFNGARIIDLDAGAPYAQVLQAALTAAFNAVRISPDRLNQAGASPSQSSAMPLQNNMPRPPAHRHDRSKSKLKDIKFASLNASEKPNGAE